MKQFAYFFIFFLCVCASAHAQSCKSLTWHAPNPFEKEMTEANPLSIQDDSIAISINWDCSTPLTAKDFVVFIDDIEEIVTRAKIKEIKGRTFKTILHLSPGKHKVVVKAANVSSPEIWIRYTGKPNLYVFSVGVPNDLAYTTYDAADIVSTFEQLRGKNLFGEVFTYLHNDATNTSKSDIKGGLTDLYAGLKYKYIQDWDFVVIYLASHGFTRNDTFFFQCKGFKNDPLYYDDYAISQYELKKYIQKITCKKLLIIDACHSAAVGNGNKEVTSRGEKDEYEFKRALQKLTQKSSSLSILTASSSSEEAAESKKWKNGVFTEALIEALTTGKCDNDRNDLLNLREVTQYVQKRVPELLLQAGIKDKTQTPTLVQNELGDDMPLYATKVLQDFEEMEAKEKVEYYVKIAYDAYEAGNYKLAFELLYKYKDSPYFKAEAQNYLGYMYYNGQGVSQDYKKAVEWYEKAANQGLVLARYNLGICYEKGQGVSQDYKKAFEWYEKAANQGYAEAQHNLGVCYEKGEGISQDYQKAFEWYEKAANQGYAGAQNNLGVCYKKGLGVSQDYKKAIQLYEKAANQGDAQAQTNLGVCYEKGEGVSQDYKKAVEWYEKAANQGLATAQYNLGLCYEKGQGVSQDYKKAVEWYEKAANQGNARAQTNLGLCYKKGQGVTQDYKKAVEWYEKAANQGEALAQAILGLCYNYGQGVSQDYKKAFEYYEKAANQGYEIAQCMLGLCYETGHGVSQDDKKAVEWYEKAASQGEATAQNNLGYCYENGKGVSKNLLKAIEFYRLAAKQGNEYAQKALTRLGEK